MTHRPTKRQLERIEQQASHEARTKATKDTTNGMTAQPPHDYLLYLRQNGLGLILAGVAFFITPYFWLGIVLFTAGSVLVGADVWKYVVIPKRTKTSKVIFGVACVLFFVVFATWLFLPVPLQFSAQSQVPRYGSGSNLYGISWSDNLSRLDFTLRNDSEVDYDDFDAEISTDLAFEGLKQTDGIVTCAIAPASKVLRPTVQRMVGVMPTGPHSSIGGVPSGSVETDITKGPTSYTVVGRNIENGEVIFSGDTALRYRIRCDKLPAHSEDTFVAATSVINPFVNGRPPEPLYSPDAKAPEWCDLKAKFTQLGRPRSITISHCKIGKICEQ